MLITVVAGSIALWKGGFYKSDLLLAFLPLSHILEQVSRVCLDFQFELTSSFLN